MKRYLAFLLLFWSFGLMAQHHAAVRDAYGTVLPNAWAGGMNGCQYGAVDVDRDGLPDLVVFDRTGNRIMPFVWGNNSYSYAPQYAHHFPEIHDWAIFIDYNGDGLKDIFTYSPGFAGMMVYRNVSLETLAFERVVYPFLLSFQGGGYTNVLVTYADYPGIYDLDSDGDLDILTFWGLGAFVELHLNLSMEKYGHADSLDYEKVDFCWGRFAESEESNVITLDTCLGGNNRSPEALLPHTGSTFLVHDMTGDGVPDLVLGDVDYPNLILLENGGDGINAEMISQDPLFPSGNVPVNIFSMPAATLLDVDRDGLDDMLVSPFDPNVYITRNKYSSWYYRNSGGSFGLSNTDFLQEGMIDVGSGAFPVLEDYDHDGLPDLFIGNYGYYDTSYYDEFLNLHSEYTSKLALFRNTGTPQQPEFSLVSYDFAGLSMLGRNALHPAFADLDGDGDKDMVTGTAEGRLLYFENVAGPGEPMEFLIAEAPVGGIDVGEYSAPAFADLDRDGLPDLVIGERNGNLNYYRNTGSSSQFVLVTDSLGKVNVTDYNISLYGFSRPSFFTDANGHLGLLVGSEQGRIFQFGHIEGNLEGTFKETDSLFNAVSAAYDSPDRGLQTSAFAADLRGNGDLDLLVGNFSGGLEYFPDEGKPGVDLSVQEHPFASLVKVFPNPAKDLLSIRLEQTGGHEILAVTLLDLHGRTISTTFLSSPEINLDMTGLEQGTYLCRILVTDGSREIPVYKKLVILR